MMSFGSLSARPAGAAVVAGAEGVPAPSAAFSLPQPATSATASAIGTTHLTRTVLIRFPRSQPLHSGRRGTVGPDRVRAQITFQLIPKGTALHARCPSDVPD